MSELWREEAKCKTLRNTSLFYPDSKDKVGIEKAKAFCADCPVKGKCRDWAYDNAEQFGVWGGMTAAEIDRKRRQDNYKPKKYAEHGTVAGYKQHLRAGVPVCRPCRRAGSKYEWEIRNRRKPVTS
jgi:WhiB family redox-sensing transcriptional regulator